jgi:hypothetical protein
MLIMIGVILFMMWAAAPTINPGTPDTFTGVSRTMNSVGDSIRKDSVKNCETIKQKRGSNNCGWEGAFSALDKLDQFSDNNYNSK